MRVDATFEFEKRRNTPVRYDRELVGATIGAMRRVKAIQEAREKRFFNTRRVGVKAADKALHRAEVAANLNLLKPAAVRAREEVVKAARAKRVSEARGILRHEADGPQLDAGISGGPALIENARPGRVARVVGEFHAP